MDTLTAEKAAALTYPNEPDANGRAKRYWQRRAYYFGEHNSARSFILFGEWKQELIDTGEAPEMKRLRIRIDARHSTDTVSHLHKSKRRWQKLFACAVVTVFGIASILFYSSRLPAVVDGKELTTDEVVLVRGMRMHRARADKREADPGRASRIADKLLALKEERPTNERLRKTNGS